MSDLIAVAVICGPTLVIMFFAARRAIRPEPEPPPPEAPRFTLEPRRGPYTYFNPRVEEGRR